MDNISALEENARRAKEANSFSDYQAGSATSEYAAYCKDADEIAQRAKDRLAKLHAPAERAEKVDYLLANYKSKMLTWLNALYTNRARVPSILIAGGSNFNVRAKERQNAREDTLMGQDPAYILDEIRGIGRNAGVIYSDDKDAVIRIKAKIAALDAAPADMWGYNKTEIRRLKERLLQLAPEEFAEQQAHISVDGAKTYEEIIALWARGRLHRSDYRPEEPHWYFDLPLNFTDGKRHYKGFVSIEVDETGSSVEHWNNDKRQSEFLPLTDARKYNLILGQIAGSGNKAVIYQYLQRLTPAAQDAAKSAEQPTGDTTDTVTVNGETAQVIRNKEQMRLQLVFADKPSDETRGILKSNGFRWAPSNSAWQRLLNDNSEYALKRAIKENN